MLDGSASTTQLSLRSLPHVKVADTEELQSKFYKFQGLLGRGTFGTVMRASELKTGIKWAIKVINKAQSGASRLKLVQREICILRAVQHPHIIHLERVFESPHTLFLVFELCLGELGDVFHKKKTFSEDEARLVVASLASAVSYLHNLDIVHRDLKLENILVSTNPSDPDDNLFIKVTDFGLSVIRGGVGQESMLQEMCGTPAYMSPELFGERMYSQQCDVWAMGVIMYLLLTGRHPFEAREGRTLAQVVAIDEPNFNCEPFKHSPQSQGANTSSRPPEAAAAKKLLCRMLEKNPAYRANALEVEEDPWTRGSEGDAPVANAMELMKMWRQEMRQPSQALSNPDSAEQARRQSRGLSIMVDAARNSARVSDERARNAAIRKTFGDLSPSESVTLLLPPTGRRPSGDSVMTASGTNTPTKGKGQMSPTAPVTPAASQPGQRRGQKVTHLAAVVEKPSQERVVGGPAPGQPGQFGVVGRERNQAASDAISTANLMPAERAPPIVYYERKGRPPSTPQRKKMAVKLPGPKK